MIKHIVVGIIETVLIAALIAGIVIILFQQTGGYPYGN